MELNSLIFPAPSPSYTYKSYPNDMIFIPKDYLSRSEAVAPAYIPCLFIKHSLQMSSQTMLFKINSTNKNPPKNKVLIYFHGNAEDLGHSYDFLKALSDALRVNIISMEYPGYGIYTQESPSSELILKNA